MYLFQPLLDKGFVGKDMHFLRSLPLLVMALFFVRGIGSFTATYAMGRVGRQIVQMFRLQLFDRLLLLPAEKYDQTTSGQLLSRIVYNVDQVTQATGEALTTLFRQGAFTLGLLAVMFMMSWQFTLFALVVMPPILIVVGYASQRFRKLSRRIQNSMGKVIHTAEETIVGYREIRIFSGQEYQRTLFKSLLNYNFTQEMKIILVDALNSPIVQLLGGIGMSCVLFFAFNRGTFLLSPGKFVALLSAMIAVLKPVRDLTKVNTAIQRGLAGAEGIFDLLDQAAEPDAGTVELSQVCGSLEFDNVSFAYRGTFCPVLKHVSFKVPAGKTVALVGKSGSGKSTLVSLLARFYQPDAGRVLLDGHDIKTLTLKNLRRHIAIVSQHVTLFDDSLLHNIAYGANDDKATEAEVIEAAKAAHAWEFIEQLPEGLHTHIGENGLNLSGGQRQRVAIARAILKNAPILILDEATSALDNHSERLVQLALERLMKTRTTLVIAHRLTTIEKADFIVMLDQGQVVETGTHQTLMEDAFGFYTKLRQLAEMP